jgi:hypothetical protein
MNTKRVVSIRWWMVAGLIAFLLAGSTPNLRAQRGRDPGINQPGAVGNRRVGRDPGINQPGAVGNRGVGRDPGINQPGAIGNRGFGGSARQTRVVGRDPGINQPGRVGNRPL